MWCQRKKKKTQGHFETFLCFLKTAGACSQAAWWWGDSKIKFKTDGDFSSNNHLLYTHMLKKKKPIQNDFYFECHSQLQHDPSLGLVSSVVPVPEEAKHTSDLLVLIDLSVSWVGPRSNAIGGEGSWPTLRPCQQFLSLYSNTASRD